MTESFCKHIKMVKKNDVTKHIANTNTPLQDPFTQAPLAKPVMCLHCGIITSEQTYVMHSQQHALRVYLADGSVQCIICTPDQSFLAPLDIAEDKKYADAKSCRSFHDYIMSCWRDRLANSVGLTKQQRRGVFGLVNLGNTCYFNSIIQALYSLEKLGLFYRDLDLAKAKIRVCSVPKHIEFYYDDVLEKADSDWQVVDYTKKKIPGSRSSKPFRTTARVTDRALNQAYQKFVRTAAQEQVHDPHQLFDQLKSVQTRFTYDQQQDAQECLRILLDALSEGQMMFLDLNMDRYRKVEKTIGPQRLSIVDNVFGSYLASRVYCNKCSHKSWTIDLTLDLEVELESANNQSGEMCPLVNKGLIPTSQLNFYQELGYPSSTAPIPKILRSFFREEQLTKSNFFKCQKCQLSNAYKKMYLIEPAPYLTVVVKRFKANLTKDTTIIDLEPEIDLSGIVLSAGDWKYELTAVVVHEGSLQQGHYTTCVKNAKLGRWLLYSDQLVKPTTWERVKNMQAYILFYTRKYTQNSK